MVAVGLVMLVLAALTALGTLFGNGADANVDFFGVSLTNVSVGGVFFGGVVTGVVGMLGLSLMLGGGARRRRKTVRHKREVQGAKGQAETLEQENARLQQELERARPAARANERPLSPADEGSSLRKDLRGQ